jgi:hypothetical protein
MRHRLAKSPANPGYAPKLKKSTSQITATTHLLAMTFICLTTGCGWDRIDHTRSAEKPEDQLITADAVPAFPGAKGYGKWAKGGRGGMVIYVTTTADNNNPGSLRYALTQSGPRTIIFRTGGTITLASSIEITDPYITIAGHTAPGSGITLKINGKGDFAPIVINTHDVIIRHLRIRPGPVSGGGENGDAIAVNGGHDIIIDHCSLSWSVDETFHAWFAPYNMTVQFCIISEGLNAGHEKGPHSPGSIMGDGTTRGTMYRNLFAHNWMRNGYFKNDRAGETSVFQFVNNLVYNWGYHGTQFGGSDGYTKIDVVGNYYKEGPNYDNSLYNDVMVWPNSSVFVQGNIGPRRPNDSMDDWAIAGYWSGPASTDGQSPTSFNTPNLPTLSAVDAYRDVLHNAGATLPARDSIDNRIVQEVENGTGSIIETPEEVGGWPRMTAGSPYADLDKDGMHDTWETDHGFDPSNPDDRNGDADGDGYTNLEEFLNGSYPG